MDELMTEKANLEEITPSKAEKWLERIPDYQRKIDPRQVKKLVLAIQKNEWRQNGATIVFNKNGELLDGQHRLTAIKEAGKSVYSVIIRGIENKEDVFHTIGDEKPRKITDFLRCSNAQVVASVSRMIYMYNNGKWPVGQGGDVIPTIELLKVTKKWEPRIQEFINPVANAGRLLRQHSFCTFLLLFYSEIAPIKNQTRLAEFFARVGDGLNLTANDPVYRLRKRFFDQITGPVKLTREVAQALIIKALHAYLDNEPMTVLRYESDREAFPELRITRS